MYKAGVTGGIGAGKGIVCKVFETLGAPVFNADLEVRRLMQTKRVKDFYYKNFGKEVFNNDFIDRAKIAAIAFSNAEALQKINAFIHPLVFESFESWSAQYAQAPYVINDAALLIESGSYKRLNHIILVTAPVEMRVQRVVERDGLNTAQVLERIKNQWPDEQKIPFANTVIENNGNTMILPQIIELHNFFLKQ